MAIKKEAHIDRIEIEASGHVGVRFAKQIVDTHAGITTIIAAENHRALFEPGDDILQSMVAINTHLSRMGFDAVPSAEISRIRAYANLAWTPAVVSAWQAYKASVNIAEAIANTGGIVVQ